jgi:DNA gyrase inhibitor GyrI
MSELDVRIVTMDPMRVASAYGFGDSPEEQAWDKILAFAQAKGLDREEARFFGFNNPDPSPGSPNYGYEQWITIGPDVEAEGDIRIVDFAGGLYASTRLRGLSNIGQAWKQLVQWFEDSPYRKGPHQWLEELLTPPESPQEEWEFILYLPISE